MKKVGIVTIYDNDNYGNRLQNYATTEVIKELGMEPVTIKNSPRLNKKESKTVFLKKYIAYILKEKYKRYTKEEKERLKCFKEFNKNINTTSKMYTIYSKFENDYDFFVAGSDQIWKPTFGRMSNMDLLDFTDDNKKIAFSASFGISEVEEKHKKFLTENLNKFKNISVREVAGEKIVKDLTGREDVEVLVDPTMLLDAKKWDMVAKKPKQLKNDKYILNYFLGELSEERKKEIERIARENNCEIINILDKKSPFYQTGPSEFLYLEKNAFLVCTDSFHSSVFSILYNVPFIVFKRENSKVNMNSRIETLLSKFELEDRYYNGKIEKESLEVDYSNAYKILENERKKSINFLKKAFELK